MTTTTDTDDPFADEEEQEEDDPFCVKCGCLIESGCHNCAERSRPVPPAPLALEQAQAKRIAQLEARIESMEQSRQVQTICTTLLQMVVSGSLEYYLTGPGQGKLEALHKITQDASEEMRHLAAQEREG